ncbi:hypothetical protein JRQ81_000912 [Phrynocephalus forsythii]|uniref:Mirror-image polydactyly 1 n=1 Tax=Phrynocephalus forsythii TaxID=171643 RepID=A0A9Q0Y6U1_9SAUR|nr:hypothetical protein JRQ81_000912 [Phrynocephalus forsythii]
MEQDAEQRCEICDHSDLNFQGSSVRSQPRRGEATQSSNEQIKPPGQSMNNFSVVQTTSAQTLHPDNFSASCTDEKLSSPKKQGAKVTPGHVDPFHVTANPDKEKDIAFLLKELDVLRANNKKLQDKLSEKDKELKTIKLDLELHERVTEASVAEKAAALVEEIHSAQWERDDAIMARLKLASEERDDAWKRIKLLEQSSEMLENINPEENDMTLQELLNRINNADSGLAIRRTGGVIVDRIYRTQERKKKITAEEMNAVIGERDAALAQCKRLEQELHHMKEQNQTSANNTRHLTAENNQERALKEKLLAMQQERETAAEQYQNLEEELQTLRIYYSLHQSLSQEVNLKDQFNSALLTYEKALKNREEVVSTLLLQNEELASQLQQTVGERANMELKFQQALVASQEANEKIQKLQRLVDVLRKKVGAGTIRTVI